MYDPENKMEQNETEKIEGVKKDTPVSPSYGYTAQPAGTQPGGSRTDPAENGSASPAPQPYVSYHSGPYAAPSQPLRTTAPYAPRTNSAAGTPGYGTQQPSRAAYTWQGQSSQPQSGSYYAPTRQTKQKKKSGGGKFLVRALAAVLACAVVSMGSVGAFTWMLKNGVVTIDGPAEESSTAFEFYTGEESGSGESQAEPSAESRSQSSAEAVTSSRPTVTGEALTQQEIAAKLTPSVVLIQNYQQTTSYSFGWFGDYETDSTLSPVGEGSGIILSKDGYIVTNQHVIDGADSLKVVTTDGVSYEAELVGEDTQTDLAVIKVTTDDELTPAEFGSSEGLQVADEVMAIGNPGGSLLSSSVTFGRISALNRPVTNGSTGYTINCIQTDAAINPGNSGGALVDMSGHVIGINSSKIADTYYEGLGFAIPSDTAQAIVSDLIEYGYVKDRAATGFSGQYVDSFTARIYGMSSGFYVSSVSSEEAEASGLRRGDLITAIDGVQVTSANTIENYIAGKKPGETVTLSVERYSYSNQGASRQSGTIELTLAENTGISESVRQYSYYF